MISVREAGIRTIQQMLVNSDPSGRQHFSPPVKCLMDGRQEEDDNDERIKMGMAREKKRKRRNKIVSYFLPHLSNVHLSIQVIEILAVIAAAA